MNPSKLADSILKKIEKEHLTPRSKYYFWIKNILFWALFAIAIIVGAISFAIIIYAGVNTDFAIADFVEDQNVLRSYLTFLPIIWVLLISVAVGIGIVGLKHTNRGYRMALFSLIGGNVLGSIILGSGLYASGGAEKIENILEKNFEAYESVREKHQKFWGNPGEKGRLSGEVVAVNTENQTMTLKGPFGKNFEVPYGKDFPLKTAPEVGSILKMKGHLERGQRFRPNRMSPAHRQKRMHRHIQAIRQTELNR